MGSKKENKTYLKEQIITYLGNKRSLLPYIDKEIKIIQKKLGKNKTVNVDLFSGSGIIARFLKKYSSKIIANDLETYSKIINECYLSNKETIDWNTYEKHKNEILNILQNKKFTKGVISKYYAPANDRNIQPGERVFYTTKNALIIDSVRNYIDSVEEPIKTLFLGQLLAEASIKTNTAGVFKGFYKDSTTGIGKYGGNGEYALKRIKGDIKIEKPILSNYSCDYEVFQQNANVLVKNLKDLDIVYIDPPYNQHPYGSNYFMLNLIIKNEEPKEVSPVSGIPKGWNKSLYNVKNKVKEEFEDLISNISSKYIIVSYNSEGFITYDEILSILNKYGLVEVKEIVYNTYRGSRNLSERSLYVTEYLFVVEVKEGV